MVSVVAKAAREYVRSMYSLEASFFAEKCIRIKDRGNNPWMDEILYLASFVLSVERFMQDDMGLLIQ